LRYILGFVLLGVCIPGSNGHCGLTIHSSRSRFAARLNSGVRPMIKVRQRLFLLASLSSAITSGCAHDPTIELYDHIAGPAVHVHSTRLLKTGSVVFEEYNITGQKDRDAGGISTLCKMSSSTAASVVQEATALTSGLPSVIYPNEPVALDGPFRSITIRNGNREIRSTSEQYTAPESPDAIRFLDVWHQIGRLLSCHGPNNSYKPKPLRGSA
jgi:hypothetical protein